MIDHGTVHTCDAQCGTRTIGTEDSSGALPEGLYGSGPRAKGVVGTVKVPDDNTGGRTLIDAPFYACKPACVRAAVLNVLHTSGDAGMLAADPDDAED